MKFILCEAPRRASTAQRARQWLYIAECAIYPGDYVEAPFGYGDTVMRVVEVGETRQAVGSEYEGAVKIISEKCSKEEVAALRRIERAEEALVRAQANHWKAVQARKDRKANAERAAYRRADAARLLAEADEIEAA